MKYHDELGYSAELMVHKWKPMTGEAFARECHHWAITVHDDHGNGKTLSKAVRLDRHCAATIYYRIKTRQIGNLPIEAINGIYTPFAMTMNDKNGRVLIFEYIGDGGDGVTMNNQSVEDAIPVDVPTTVS